MAIDTLKVATCQFAVGRSSSKIRKVFTGLYTNQARSGQHTLLCHSREGGNPELAYETVFCLYTGK